MSSMNLSRVTSVCVPVVSAAALLAALSAPVWAEGNAAAGKQKTRTCEGCHGIPDFRTAYPDVYSVPKLGGQNAGYIVKALQDYKPGARKHPTMRGIAANLSDQDMVDLAAYYADSGPGK
jgi:cytochrome c553